MKNNSMKKNEGKMESSCQFCTWNIYKLYSYAKVVHTKFVSLFRICFVRPFCIVDFKPLISAQFLAQKSMGVVPFSARREVI